MEFELSNEQISKAEVNGVANYFERIEIHTDTGEYFAGRSGIAHEAQKELVKWLIQNSYQDSANRRFSHNPKYDRGIGYEKWEALLNHFGVKEEE